MLYYNTRRNQAQSASSTRQLSIIGPECFIITPVGIRLRVSVALGKYSEPDSAWCYNKALWAYNRPRVLYYNTRRNQTRSASGTRQNKYNRHRVLYYNTRQSQAQSVSRTRQNKYNRPRVLYYNTRWNQAQSVSRTRQNTYNRHRVLYYNTRLNQAQSASSTRQIK